MNLNPKVRNSTIASALVVLVLAGLQYGFDINLTPEQVGAATVIISLIVGYFTNQGSWTPKS